MKFKEEFLRLLDEDREFRYAVMGRLGFTELLERFARLEERQAALEERQAALEERQQRLEELFAGLEERFARLEERQQRLEEHFARLEERQQRLEERQQRLEERVARVEEELRENRRVLAVISHRFGILTEVGFREAMKYVVEEVLGAAKVEKWSYRDEEGFVYGVPSDVEVDLVVRDEAHILMEVKSRVSAGDVSELYRIGELYRRVTGVKPRLLILGGFIDFKARGVAERLGVEVRPISRDLLAI